MWVRFDLTNEPWELIALTRQRHAGRSQRVSHYRYGTHPDYCFLMCVGTPVTGLIGRVVEVSIERDVGGPVLTVHRVVTAEDAEARYPSLQELVWRIRTNEL